MGESGGVSENFLKYFMKFVEGTRKLKSVLVDRDEEIDTIACAFLTGTNVLLIGEPGTGKSLVVNEFAKLVGMGPENGYFHYLLTKYTEPSEILGPIDIKSLREGKYEVITKNKLPEASLVFLDEVFNANSAILNSLLTLINEKKLILGNMYKNMDDLICVYGA
ncbi:MAG TPA: AAA family ATPase, partial [Fervidobacterium sp.]|nr:AAA family ATPase [Fervidobacterium sp.]